MKPIKKRWYAGFILGKTGVKTISKIEMYFPKIQCWQPVLQRIIFEDGIRIVKEETMFDNYIFLFLPENDHQLKREIVEKTPVVYFLDDYIKDEEVFHLLSVQSMRTVSKPKKWIGENVKIIKGAYEGFDGKCIDTIGNHAIVEINLHDIEKRKVRLGFELIRLCSEDDEIKIYVEEGGEYVVTRR